MRLMLTKFIGRCVQLTEFKNTFNCTGNFESLKTFSLRLEKILVEKKAPTQKGRTGIYSRKYNYYRIILYRYMVSKLELACRRIRRLRIWGRQLDTGFQWISNKYEIKWANGNFCYEIWIYEWVFECIEHYFRWPP